MNTGLIEAARLGGREDIERLMEAVWPEAYRLAFSVLGGSQAAEDAAQDACVVIYRSIGGLRSTAAFRTWLYRIVVRACTAQKRRDAQLDAPVERISNGERSEALDVWRALDTLPPHLRRVVVLRYFEDLSSREIAAILQIPGATVRFHLANARRRMRPLLDDSPESTSQTVEVKIHAV